MTNLVINKTFHSVAGKNFTERVEKLDYGDVFKPGEIVGINAEGKLTKSFSNSIHFGIVTGTSSAMIAHNNLTDENSAIVVFAGRIEVETSGKVGSYLVPFKETDGSIGCLAMEESEMNLSHYAKSIGHIISVTETGVYIIVKH
jgi:hypothetical protein